MRNWLTALTTLFVGSTLSLSAWDSRSYLQFDSGYRNDNISWDFKAPSPDPLIESRLRFDQVQIFQIGLSGKLVLDCNVYARASASYGWILDGDAKETLKVFEDEDEVEFDKIENILDGKYVADLSIGLGYQFYFCDCTLLISPTVGYSYDSLYFVADVHDQPFFEIEDDEIELEDEDGCCRNKFVNRWYGPWIGFDLNYNPNGCLSLYAQFEYHFANFKGKRNSEIGIQDWDDYNAGTHNGHGTVVNLGGNYLFCDCWYIGLNFTYKDFHAHKRSHINDDDLIDALKEQEERECCDFHERNKNDWRSFYVGVSVGKIF